MRRRRSNIAMTVLLLVASAAVPVARGQANASDPDKPYTMDRATLEQYSGAYQWAPNRFVYVQLWAELGKDQLAAFDEAGKVRGLFPLGPDLFVVGTGVGTPSPVEAHVVFTRGAAGAMTSFEWQPESGAAHAVPRAAVFHADPVSFSDGAVTLSGTLYSPLGPGPHPAIILAPGAGPADRNLSLPFALFLVRHGIAVLTYDKRGVGASNGDWQKSSFDDLARDALAAAHSLAMNAAVVPAQIGVMGVDEGGTVAALAASHAPEIGFLIAVSSSAETPAAQSGSALANEMKINGFSPANIAAAQSLARSAAAYAASGDGWDAYLQQRRDDEKQDWFPFLRPPADRDDPQWTFQRLNLAYDPATALARVHCPVLAVFGGRDPRVPAPRNSDLWATALRKGGNHRYAVTTIPSGNHLLLDSHTGSQLEFPRLQSFDTGYAYTVLHWLIKNVPGVSE